MTASNQEEAPVRAGPNKFIPLLFHGEPNRSRLDNVAGARYSEYVPKIDPEHPKNVAQRLKGKGSEPYG